MNENVVMSLSNHGKRLFLISALMHKFQEPTSTVMARSHVHHRTCRHRPDMNGACRPRTFAVAPATRLQSPDAPAQYAPAQYASSVAAPAALILVSMAPSPGVHPRGTCPRNHGTSQRVPSSSSMQYGAHGSYRGFCMLNTMVVAPASFASFDAKVALGSPNAVD